MELPEPARKIDSNSSELRSSLRDLLEHHYREKSTIGRKKGRKYGV